MAGQIHSHANFLSQPAPGWLPDFILDLNLLRVFIWYVAILFLISLALRIRFYLSIYDIARYVAEACPSVFRLVHEHWFLCVRDRFLTLVGLYGGILAAYLLVSRLVWPAASVSVRDLADADPLLLVGHVVLFGLMVATDLVLVLQTSVVDKNRIIQDLAFAERWLGGKVYSVLDMLGRWNPIKNYADNLTAQTMVWFNVLFRGSVRSMIVQTVLRVFVGSALFISNAVLHPM